MAPARNTIAAKQNRVVIGSILGHPERFFGSGGQLDGLPWIPKKGTINPNMGTIAAARSGLADALFSRVQQRILGLIFGQPDRRFQSAELIRLAHGGTGAAHRQLRRLADAGWLAVSRTGNQKYYQANRDCPAFGDLHGLIVKTVGLVEPLRRSLERRSREIHAAFVYGSVAKGTEKARSDIDLMVLSDRLTYADVMDAVQSAEETLSRTVNPNVMTPADWRRKKASSGSFVARIAAQPRLFVFGSDNDL